MNKAMIPGIFFSGFIGLSCLAGLLFLGPAFSGAGFPNAGEALNGVWTARFEKNLNEKLPIYDPSRNFWGRGEYKLFHQGRKGVVVGDKGWLFTDEEFSCPKNGPQMMADNLSYMESVKDQLQQNGVRLAVVAVPAKTRIYPEHLGQARVPSCRDYIYDDMVIYLKKHNIQAINLLSVFRAQPDRGALYLKTDTHWSPSGARLAAVVTAHEVQTPTQEEKIFSSWSGATEVHKGDLLRYLPGVNAELIAPDSVQSFTTELAEGENADGLFGDHAPLIALVGTSYSANKLWNFEGFLKEAFRADVLNMADEGQGPFAVMKKYLGGDEWKNSPPRLVIWEVPERYMTMEDANNAK